MKTLSVAVFLMMASSASAQLLEYSPNWTWHDKTGLLRTAGDLRAILAAITVPRPPDLAGADLTDAPLQGADLSDLYLWKTKLRNAHLVGAHFERAFMEQVDLSGAQLAGAHFEGTNLTAANLTDADLDGATFAPLSLIRADMSRVAFSPERNPDPGILSRALHLESLRYDIVQNNPGPLIAMRRTFEDSGFRDVSRQLTFALRKTNAEILARLCRDPLAQTTTAKLDALESCLDLVFNVAAFDWTCRYGMSPGRPLILVFGMWVVCGVLYALFIHLPGRTGLYVVAKQDSTGKQQGMRVVPHRLPVDTRRNHFGPPRMAIRWLRQEWRLLRTAMMFSMMSASNIGFREIDFGKWIRLFMKRPYDLRAEGWMRTISGVQSVFSAFMVALWALTYFGHPFD